MRNAERRLNDIAAALDGRKCSICRDWSPFVVLLEGESTAGGWPDSLVCSSCGRGPITVVYIRED